MAGCDVALNCAIPSRFYKELEVGDTLKSVLITGNQYDSSNLPTSTLDEYDSAKTDYKIGDRVKIDNVKTEYICGVEDTRIHPLLSTGTEWHKIGSTNDFKFKDGSPHSQSFGEVDTNLEITLEVGKTGNFLFVQNMRNVKEIIVEMLAFAPIEIHREDTYKLVKFSPCSCCNIRYEYMHNFTLPLDPCGLYSTIRVTFVPIEETRAGVGVCAVGEYIEVGKFHDYPVPSIQSDFKFSLEEQGLALPVNTNIFMNYSFTLEELSTDFQNEVYEKLINNIGALNFYEITNFKKNMFTTFVGTHKGFKPKITNQNETSIAIDIYAIPTKDKGVN